MAPKRVRRKRRLATADKIRAASGRLRSGHPGPSAQTASEGPSGLCVLCVSQNALEEFLACHEACAIRNAAKPLAGFAVLHFVRCCSDLSLAAAARVASGAAISRLRTVALAASWGEGGYVLGVLLVERFAHHAACVSNAFLEGRCSLTGLAEALDPNPSTLPVRSTPCNTARP